MDFEQKLHRFEKKWQKEWEERETFQPEPDNREKFFITVAYPYPSGGMHIGHVRTYTLPDVFARFKRMEGKNVLFPMAWHVTGTPIIGAVNRLKNKEEKQLKVLKDTYNVPEEDLKTLETPMEFANYFIENSYKKNMKRLGFSVDWRREFTTNDDKYNRFIEWQYKTLKEKGLVKKGKHPTKYCTSDENPVTTHDLLEGENAEQQDYTLVKFEKGNKKYPMATLRPETVYGVTHALVNPEAEYVEIKIDGEFWIVSKEAADKLEHQNHDLIVKRTIKGQKLVGRKIENPVNHDHIYLLPADFVDPDSGSGLVMSVPGHAPYDWISLKELKEDKKKLKEYGLNPKKVGKIKPKSIIKVEGYGEFPAKEEVEKLGINSQKEEEKLEKATEKVYKKEFHNGQLKENCGPFGGTDVNKVKDKIVEQFKNKGKFSSMWDFSEKVVCRCGGKVIVAETDTWFLEYGKKSWKDKADKALGQMETIPESTRTDYNHTINWLESWPCIRNYGLGTKLPFDKDFVVEPLSDSTIYMSYYTINHMLEEVDAEQLDKELFDYVFRGVGPVEEVSDKTDVPVKKLKELRESFQYWYPLDWRTSANDLIQNHLTFMMFHHSALFEEKHWPKGIVIWGMGLLEGRKMSSSKGHVVLPEEAINRYGADTVRFFMFSTSEPWQNFDWREKEVKKAKKKLENFYTRTLELYNTGETGLEKDGSDIYLESKLQEVIKNTTESLEKFQTRKASLQAFFRLNNLVNSYVNDKEVLNQDVLNNVLETQVKLLTPFIPHIGEQLWKEFGKEGLASESDWPQYDEEKVNREVEYTKELLDKTVSDIKDIQEIVEEFSEAEIIVATGWKHKAFKKMREMLDENSLDVSNAMNEFTSDKDLRPHANRLVKFVNSYKKNPGKFPDKILGQKKEVEVFKNNISKLEKRIDAKVKVVREKQSKSSKAKKAEPGRPAIHLE